MISVFGGFVFSHLAMVRPLGFGMAIGVLLDAFVVRMLIVPALMHLAGDAAWKLPRWLDRILPNVDVEGAALERTHPVVPVTETAGESAGETVRFRQARTDAAPIVARAQPMSISTLPTAPPSTARCASAVAASGNRWMGGPRPRRS